MAVTVVFPFGALNNIPGVSGVDDVTLTIPDVGDILQIVQENTLDPDDVVDGVVDGLEEALPEPLVGLDDVQAFFEPVLDALDDQTDDVEDVVEETIGEELSDLDLDPGSINLDPDELADDIADQIDIPDPEVDAVSFESVFGALSDDIAEGFEEALEEVIEEVGDLPDDIADIGDDVNDLDDAIDEIPELEPGDLADELGDAVIDQLAGQPGGDVLLDPDSFVDDQLDRVDDLLISDEVEDEIQEALEAFD